MASPPIVIDVPTSPTAGTAVETPAGGSPTLWGRWWNLVVGTSQGATISLVPFHIQFNVEMGAFQSPWKMVATIINVPQELAREISKEYTAVALAGGYQQVQRGDLFFGQITFFEYGKLTPTETFLRIHAATADIGINQSMINQTLPAGHTANDVVKAAVGAMPSVSLGYVSPLSPSQSPRGRTLFGMPRDILRDVSQTENACTWVDSTGKLNMVKQDDTGYQSDVIEINQSNGLVGIPSQQLGQGITVRCLLNYAILPGKKIRLNTQDVNRVVGSSGGPTADLDTSFQVGTTAPVGNGVYQAYSVRHVGDNRGTPWYTEIVTMPTDPEKVQMGVGG